MFCLFNQTREGRIVSPQEFLTAIDNITSDRGSGLTKKEFLDGGVIAVQLASFDAVYRSQSLLTLLTNARKEELNFGSSTDSLEERGGSNVRDATAGRAGVGNKRILSASATRGGRSGRPPLCRRFYRRVVLLSKLVFGR